MINGFGGAGHDTLWNARPFFSKLNNVWSFLLRSLTKSIVRFKFQAPMVEAPFGKFILVLNNFLHFDTNCARIIQPILDNWVDIFLVPCGLIDSTWNSNFDISELLHLVLESLNIGMETEQ